MISRGLVLVSVVNLNAVPSVNDEEYKPLLIRCPRYIPNKSACVPVL